MDFGDDEIFIVRFDSLNFLLNSWGDHFVLFFDDGDFVVNDIFVVMLNFDGLFVNQMFSNFFFVEFFSFFNNSGENTSWDDISSDFFFDDLDVCSLFCISDQFFAMFFDHNFDMFDLLLDDFFIVMFDDLDLLSDNSGDDWVLLFDDINSFGTCIVEFVFDQFDFVDEGFFGLFFDDLDLFVAMSIDFGFDGLDQN